MSQRTYRYLCHRRERTVHRMRTTLVTLLLCACGTETQLASTDSKGPNQKPTYQGGGAPLTSACDFDSPRLPVGVLAGSTQTEAFLIKSDGSKVSLVTAGAQQTWISAPQSRGQF